MHIYTFRRISREIHLSKWGPILCSYKTRDLQKNLQNDWVLQGNGLNDMFGLFLFAMMLTKSEAFISLLLLPIGGELCWKARLTGTSGMAVNFEISIVTTLQHACTQVQERKQNSYSRKKTSNIRAKYTSVQNGGVMKRGGWCTRPHHFGRDKNHWNPIIL